MVVDNGENQDSTDSFQDAVRLIDEGRNREALSILQTVIEKNPEHVEAINKAGVAYARLDEMESAEKCFLEALYIDHSFVPALSNLGNIYMQREDYNRAIALYQKALKYHPEYAVAHNNIAAAYKQVGKVDKQVHHYKRSQKLKLRGPDDAGATGGIRKFWNRLRGRNGHDGQESSESTSSESSEHQDDNDAFKNVGKGRWGCMGAWVVLLLLVLLLIA